MLDIVNADIKNESMFTTLFDSDNYQDIVNLCLKAISDSEIYRVFQKIPENSEYFKERIINLAGHKNFEILRDGFKSLQENNPSYLKKSVFQLAMCDIIEKCKSNNTVATTTTSTPVRQVRPIR